MRRRGTVTSADSLSAGVGSTPTAASMGNFDRQWKTRLSDLVTSKSDKLEEWEIQFIDKLNRLASQAKFGRQPSECELACIYAIWHRVFG